MELRVRTSDSLAATTVVATSDIVVFVLVVDPAIRTGTRIRMCTSTRPGWGGHGYTFLAPGRVG
eukprot:scaffold179338_cov15-Prasinocladus_malaysianus.AAC.1